MGGGLPAQLSLALPSLSGQYSDRLNPKHADQLHRAFQSPGPVALATLQTSSAAPRDAPQSGRAPAVPHEYLALLLLGSRPECCKLYSQAPIGEQTIGVAGPMTEVIYAYY